MPAPCNPPGFTGEAPRHREAAPDPGLPPVRPALTGSGGPALGWAREKGRRPSASFTPCTLSPGAEPVRTTAPAAGSVCRRSWP